MKIDIDNTETERAMSLRHKFIELNQESINECNYFDKDVVHVRTNENSGYSYIYLESNPSIAICLSVDDNLEVIHSSSLDGIEFKKPLRCKSMLELEEMMHAIYDKENDIREDDYENTDTLDIFIHEMVINGWTQL